MPPRQEAALPRGPLGRAPALRPRARGRDVPRPEVAQALRAQGRQGAPAAPAAGNDDSSWSHLATPRGRGNTWSPGQGGEGEGGGRGRGAVQGQAGEEGEGGEEEEAEGGGGE